MEKGLQTAKFEKTSHTSRFSETQPSKNCKVTVDTSRNTPATHAATPTSTRDTLKIRISSKF